MAPPWEMMNTAPATQARAKWDFVPEEPSGLALTADDELEVWPTEKGWWFARKKRGGYEGYVPRDYVRVEGRHAEAAFPGLAARVATISPRRAEPPRKRRRRRAAARARAVAERGRGGVGL